MRWNTFLCSDECYQFCQILHLTHGYPIKFRIGPEQCSALELDCEGRVLEWSAVRRNVFRRKSHRADSDEAFGVEGKTSTELQPDVMITAQNTVTGKIETTALTLTEIHRMEETWKQILRPEAEVSSMASSNPTECDIESQAISLMHDEPKLTSSQPMVPEPTVQVDTLTHPTTTKTSACRRMQIKFLHSHIGAPTDFC